MEIRLIVVKQETGISEALEEMQSLLRSTCSAATPNRISAVRYTLCRTILMDGELRPSLPGFLIQCVSVFKFHDFISLFDPKAEARIAFVENAFASSRAMLESKRIYDVFSDPDF
jgi:hypothetical protein